MNKRILLTFCLVMFVLSGFSQEKKIIQNVTKIGDTFYAEENGERFLINTERIIAKPIVPVCQLEKELKILYVYDFGYIDIEVPKETNVIDFISKLEQSGKFEIVEFLAECKPCLKMYDDSYSSFCNQWLVDKILLERAWDITTGNSNIKVAIIDTGVYRDHPDLGYGNNNYTNISYNLGYDYINNCQYQIPNVAHGTNVAGIIGAKGNNNIGIAGITGGYNNSGVTIMAYNSLIPNTSTTYFHQAINNAVNNGANIINCSIKTITSTSAQAALQYAYNNGVIVVCSSGNENTNTLSFPASYLNTIAVGASTSNDLRWTDTDIYTGIVEGSNYGNGLDIVAPVSFYTTDLSGGYTYLGGTSAAAPVVSGTIALMLSVNSSLTPTQIRNILRKTAKKLTSYTYNNDGWNTEVGYGLIDSFSAVLLAGNTQFLSQSVICSGSTATYTLNNLPSSMSVNWSITNFSNSISLPINASGNSCTITNNCTESFSGTVNAAITYNGNTIATLKQDLIVHGSLNAHYYQGNNTGTISSGTPIYVSKGTPLYIESPNFRNMNVSWNNSYTQPSNWYYDNDQLLILTYPSDQIYNLPIIVNVTAPQGQPTCNNFQIVIYGNNSKNWMNVVKENGELLITIIPTQVTDMNIINEHESQMEKYKWELNVYNAYSGQKIVNEERIGFSSTLNISGWKAGIYIITATINDEILSEKIVIK